MSTIKSSAENLTLNADGSGNDIIFQSNGSNVATLDQAGTLTATTFTGAATDATKLPLAGGTMTGALNATNSANTAEIKVGAETAKDFQGYSGVQFDDRGFIGGYPNDSLGIFYNTYHSSGSKAIDTAAAANIQLINSGIRFQTAASVSADAAQTMVDRLMITTAGLGQSQFTARAWIQLNHSGNSITDSHNISGFTDVGEGDLIISFDVDMANNDYAAVTNSSYRDTSGRVSVVNGHTYGTGSVKFRSEEFNDSSDAWYHWDLTELCVVVFGD